MPASKSQQPESDASSICVAVRVRPFTIREAAQLTTCDDGMLFLGDGSLATVPAPKLMQKGIRPVLKVVDDRCLIFDPPEDNPVHRFSKSVVPSKKKVKDQTFMFDRVFDENTSQRDVYEATTRNLLDSVMDGYNATVLAYGATGCGKTHTISGTTQQPGIIFLTMQELFERIGERAEEKATEISISYLEIYNETIRDLLAPSPSSSSSSWNNGSQRGGLSLREDANQTVSVPGLSMHHPRNVHEVMEIVMRGNDCRTMSPTEANATSSRSHAVLQINVSQRDKNSSVNEPHTMATLSIIDLAGSERASTTKNRGERLLEGANINRSLLALGSCINALCDPRKHAHVPYRDSKLTRLLKFSLGGNCKTVMIVCVSPSSQHFDETQNTLRYANRAKNIQTKLVKNVYNVNRHVKDFLVKIDEQRALIDQLTKQQKDHEQVAFSKFRKQTEKKDAVVQEGLFRLRNAFGHAASERNEKTRLYLHLKRLDLRIQVLRAWIAAFDGVRDKQGDSGTLASLHTVHGIAQDTLAEMEQNRENCRTRLCNMSWDRAINTALDLGLKQLQETQVVSMADNGTLTREAELLKLAGEREIAATVIEHEGVDMDFVQALLHANMKAISGFEGVVTRIATKEGVGASKKLLRDLHETCFLATSNVVQPSGGKANTPAIDPFMISSPRKTRSASKSPRKQQQHHQSQQQSSYQPYQPSLHLTFDPTATALPPPLSPHPKPLTSSIHDSASTPAPAPAPQLALSPIKSLSPRKRGAREKDGSASPDQSAQQHQQQQQEQQQQQRASKRSVRWKDDVEDGAALAEIHSSPEKSRPSTSSSVGSADSEDHYYSPPPPVASDLMEDMMAMPSSPSMFGTSPSRPRRTVHSPKPSSQSARKGGRFKDGFLSKKSAPHSPPPPNFGAAFSKLAPSSRSSFSLSSPLGKADKKRSVFSDIENSSFLDRAPGGNGGNRRKSEIPQLANKISSSFNESASAVGIRAASSPVANQIVGKEGASASLPSSSDKDEVLQQLAPALRRLSGSKIRSRQSGIGGLGPLGGLRAATTTTTTAAAAARRRGPTDFLHGSSPLARSEKSSGDWKNSILSPRVAPVMKSGSISSHASARRATLMGGDLRGLNRRASSGGGSRSGTTSELLRGPWR